MDTRKVVINAPPPYLNSALHIGHLYSFSTLIPFYNLVDFLSREKHFKTSNLYFNDLNIPRVTLTLSLGVDINGLPLTRAAKERITVTGNSFQQECKDIIETNTKNITNIYSDLGLYNLRDVKEYTTSDTQFESLYTEFLEQMNRRKFITEAELPHRYCNNCSSFLSNSETESVSQDGHKYELEVYDLESPTTVYSIMTTRPEFLPGVVAFVANPNDQRYIHLKDKTLGFCFENKTYSAPVLFTKYIHPSVGTGLAYITRWSSTHDVEICRELRLTGSSSIYSSDGNLLPEITTNHKVYELKSLKEKILNSGLVKPIETSAIKVLRHTQRGDCKSQVLFINSSEIVLTPDNKVLDQFIEYVNNIDIPIKSFKNQLIDNIKSLRQWCISRPEEYYSFSYKFNNRTFKLDTWVISGLSHYINSYENDQIWRIQGSDIIRTWLLYTLFINFILGSKHRRITSCYIHKMVVDENYQKISKSRNNGPDASKLLQETSLPSLRYYFCQKPFDGDFAFNKKELSDTSKFFTKVKNLDYKIRSSFNQINHSIWIELLKKIRTNSFKESPLIRFIKELDYFFEVDLHHYYFSRILNKLKTFVYFLSTNLHKISIVIGEDISVEYGPDVILKIWDLIIDFLSCF